MRRMLLVEALALTTASATATSAVAKDRPPREYGPPPTWDQFCAMGGIDDAMRKVVSAAGATATLTSVGGNAIFLKAPK